MPDSNVDTNTHKSSRVWLYFLIVAIAVAGAWWAFMPSKENQQTVPGPRSMFGMRAGNMGSIPVRTANAELRNINYTLRIIGTATPLSTVTVRSRVDGELQNILFADGSKVTAGDTLAQIDPNSYEIQLNQALGQYAQTQAQLANAQNDLQRYQKLFKQNSIARQQLDSQTAQVEQLLANLKSNQASVDNAKLQLSYTQIKAPITGMAGLRKIDAGNLINASSSDGLVVITQTQPINVVFSVPQSDIPAIHLAMKKNKALPVSVLDSDGTTVLDNGSLVAMDNQIDTTTGTVTLKAQLPNEKETLFPNQFVNVQLKVDTQNVLAIPSSAVQYGSIGAFVYVIDSDGKASVQGIETGQTDSGYIAVNAGLEVNAEVVIEGIDRLREGSQVEFITDQL